MFIFAAGQF